MKKGFWASQTVAVIGSGSWGTVLAQLSAANCQSVKLWTRSEEHARQMNSSRVNAKYLPDMKLSEKISVHSDFDRIFETPVDIVIWALPSSATRERAHEIAKYFQGDELIIHATKGIEPGTLKRVSTVLTEEIPIRRVGVISGPNLAKELALKEPAATVIASGFPEVIDAGIEIFRNDYFKAFGASDMIGVEWAGTLKNILAIASGTVEGLKLGWNTRATLMTRGLAEMIRFGVAMGAEKETFLGLAGMGDLLATCSSNLSRNFRVGFGLAQGKSVDEVLKELGSTAEGVRTTESVWKFAKERGIAMPITEQVYKIITNQTDVGTGLKALMNRPERVEFW